MKEIALCIDEAIEQINDKFLQNESIAFKSLFIDGLITRLELERKALKDGPKTCENCEYRDIQACFYPCSHCTATDNRWAPRIDMHLRAYGG